MKHDCRHYKQQSYYMIAALLFCLSPCWLQGCKPHPKAEKQAPAAVRQELDSINNLVHRQGPGRALVLQQKRMQIARQYGLVREQVNTYCYRSYVYGQVKVNFDSGRMMLDSAAGLIRQTGRTDLQPLVDVHYSILFRFDDSSYYYIQKAMPHLEELTDREKVSAMITMANVYYERKSYKAAMPYYLKSLELAQAFKPRNPRAEAAIYGNIGNNYQMLGDEARYLEYCLKAYDMIRTYSIEEGGEAEHNYQSLGQYYIGKGKPDSALIFIQKYAAVVKRNYPVPMHVFPNIQLAEIARMKKQYRRADSLLASFRKFTDTITNAPLLPPETVSRIEAYYFTLIQLRKAEGRYAEAIQAREKQDTFKQVASRKQEEDLVVQYERQQEKAKAALVIAQKEKTYASNRLLLFLAIAVLLLLLAIAINIAIVFRNRKRKEARKLLEQAQANLIEKKELLLQAETTERGRIARELHDELGSAITVIGMVTKSMKGQDQEGIAESIEILQRNSTKLTAQVNEIVWSLNDRNDSLGNLLAFVYRYSRQFLTDTGLEHTLDIVSVAEPMVIEGYKRRYLFHSVKECLNNIVRHSGATAVTLTIKIEEAKLIILIQDNGKGIADAANPGAGGNGMTHIRRNISALGGRVAWLQEQGTLVRMEVPLEELKRAP